jgi:alpha-glucosidase (family GH31 glycosyl hydrolase)
MIEPMYYEYPDDENAYTFDGQYFFGDAFLCAPITAPLDESGIARQTVWIANGSWYDFFTGEKYDEGTHIISCPLDRFPLLVKGGIPIPMQNYTKRMTTTPLNHVIVTCFPGEKGDFSLYEDDGVSKEFENGAFLKTKLVYKNENGMITIEILPEGKGYQNMPDTRSYQIELMQTEKKLSLVEGEGDIVFEENKNTILLPKQDIKKTIKIVLQ